MSMRIFTTVCLALLVSACAGHRGSKPSDGGGKACGGIAGVQCKEKQFCELPAGKCHAADLQGVCEPRPEICTKDYRPVCGCDGKTYGNDCTRKGAAVQKNHDGECASHAEVQVVGCPYAGVEAGCLMIDGQGETYDISSATPKPKIGMAISLRGKKSSNPTTCQQGVPLEDIAWKYTKKKCPRSSRVHEKK